MVNAPARRARARARTSARSLPSISLTRERVFTGARTAPTRDPTVQLHHHQHRKNASRDPHAHQARTQAGRTPHHHH